MDHGFIRSIYFNLHPISDKMWRSAQPSPTHVRRLARNGVKTIINLRGVNASGHYELEKEACEKHGVNLVSFAVSSRDMPKVEWITGLRDIFNEIEYPAVLHCKSGADRAGLVATLFAFVHEGRELNDALGQMSIRYGHIKQAKTGLIDHFFLSYKKRNEESPIEFFEWVEGEYASSRLELKEEFMTRGWASVLVDTILRRE